MTNLNAFINFLILSDLVLKMLSATADSDESKETIAEVEKLVPLVKEIAASFKKAGVKAAE